MLKQNDDTYYQSDYKKPTTAPDIDSAWDIIKDTFSDSLNSKISDHADAVPSITDAQFIHPMSVIKQEDKQYEMYTIVDHLSTFETTQEKDIQQLIKTTDYACYTWDVPRKYNFSNTYPLISNFITEISVKMNRLKACRVKWERFNRLHLKIRYPFISSNPFYIIDYVIYGHVEIEVTWPDEKGSERANNAIYRSQDIYPDKDYIPLAFGYSKFVNNDGFILGPEKMKKSLTIIKLDEGVRNKYKDMLKHDLPFFTGSQLEKKKAEGKAIKKAEMEAVIAGKAGEEAAFDSSKMKMTIPDDKKNAEEEAAITSDKQKVEDDAKKKAEEETVIAANKQKVEKVDSNEEQSGCCRCTIL